MFNLIHNFLIFLTDLIFGKDNDYFINQSPIIKKPISYWDCPKCNAPGQQDGKCSYCEAAKPVDKVISPTMEGTRPVTKFTVSGMDARIIIHYKEGIYIKDSDTSGMDSKQTFYCGSDIILDVSGMDSRAKVDLRLNIIEQTVSGMDAKITRF